MFYSIFNLRGVFRMPWMSDGVLDTPELGVVDVAYLYVVKWKLLVMIVARLQF